MGWSDRASVCLAIEKTADIITSAGVIMAISFAGLLIPKTTVLNQYGFSSSISIGVVFDTFLIRTIVAPVIFAVVDFNYTPYTKIAKLVADKNAGYRAFADR